MVLAAVLYCTMLLEALYGFPLSLRHSTLSELAALNQPTSTVARSVDLASGLLLICGALLLLPLGRRSWAARAGLAGLVVLGVGTVMADLSPLPCAPSLSERCREAAEHAAERADQHPAALEIVLHLATSGLASVGAVVLSLTTLWLLRGTGRSTSTVVARVAAWVVIATSLLLGVETVVAAGPDDEGLVQRSGVLAVCVLVALLPRLLIRATSGGADGSTEAPR